MTVPTLPPPQTSNNVVGSVLTSFSIIPFMRYLPIDFLGYRLRPNRQVWFYFDDKSVDKFIQRPNIIVTKSDERIPDARKGKRKTLYVSPGPTARVLHAEKNVDSGNTVVYVSEFTDAGAWDAGGLVKTTDNNFISTWEKYHHYSGILQSGSTNNSIVLAYDASQSTGHTDNYYVGNTVTIVNGTNAGQAAEIVQYTASTRTALLDPPLAINSKDSNLIYTIGDYRSWYAANTYPASYVTERGLVSGVFHVPDPAKNPLAKFRTGDRVFRILDNPRNDTGQYTTRADYRFTSGGSQANVAQIIERSVDSSFPVIPAPSPTPTPTKTLTPTTSASLTPPISVSVTPTRTPTRTVTPSVSVSETPDPSPQPTRTPTPSVSLSETPDVSITPTRTITPTLTPTVTPTKTPTKTPTVTPSNAVVDPCAAVTSGDDAATWSWTKAPKDRKSLSQKLTARQTASDYSGDGDFYRGHSGCSIGRIVYCRANGNIRQDLCVSQTRITRQDAKNGKNSVSLPFRIPGDINTPAGTRFGVSPGFNTPTDSDGRIYIRVWMSFNPPEGFYEGRVNDRASPPIDITGIYFWQLFYEMDLLGRGQCLKIPHDPVAQTFYVSAVDNPDGVFISSVDLFFKNRGETLPVEVQLRPVVNGAPSSNTIIPGATTTLDPDEINVSDFPDAANASTNTRFTFPNPVYLQSGSEYAVVVITDDYGYDYYSAEKGQTIIGTNQVVSQQPFMGSLFKSQNQMTWTPIQEEDMMFIINKAAFEKTGTVIFDENKKQLLREISSNVAYNSFDSNKSNTYYDSFELRSDNQIFNNTDLKYYFKGVTNTSLTLDSAYRTFAPDKKFDLADRNIIFNPELENKSLTVRVDMASGNPDVSPVIYHQRQNLITVENLINNTGLTADRFTISNPGSGYTQNTFIDITSPVGYGANVRAIANLQTGTIDSIVVNSPGSGYVDNIVATINGGGGTGATVNVSTETGTSGGPALARYISKTVTLLDGFDAGDLRLFLTAVKPPGSNVNVYYKVRNSFDPDPIEERNWVRMTQKTSQYTFSINRQPVEYEFRPSLTSNNVTYSTETTTYKTFNQFAIKIVLSSENTVANSIPYVLDVRAIAMPEDAY